MDYFAYKSGELHCEEADVAEIVRQHGTPAYIYSARTIVHHFHQLKEAFAESGVPCTICYSVKANSSLAILSLMKKEGAGFDVVSGGEIHRALKIGADPKKIVFAGVGKSDDEIAFALRNGILLFNVESEQELEVIDEIAAKLGQTASVALRVNPDVDPHTHMYITTGKRENKFGLDLERARSVIAQAKRYAGVRIGGLHIHIGSQITSASPYVEALSKLTAFLDDCRKAGCPIEWLDIGGGFGIYYEDRAARSAREMADAILPFVKKSGCKLLLEPGRFIVGNGGILVMKVLYVKDSGDKKFVICDAGMNDLIRPTLYKAYHRIWPVKTDRAVAGAAPDEKEWKGETVVADVVGPICESGDYFALGRKLPPVKRGDLLALFSAGAYGYSMSSNYNSHPRPCEILVNGKTPELITERESNDSLVRNEHFAERSRS